MDGSNRRIVLLGKTGVGKNSLANTILGEKLFTVNHSLNSGTRKCQAETRSVHGRSVTLIDTPGFFDTHRSEEELKVEIVKCITECAPGPHAFLIVLKVERITKQEQAVIDKIHQHFSEKVFKYATVVFTHGDQLPEGRTIKDFVSMNKLVSDLVKTCGGRCHVIDNKYWNENPKEEYRSNQFQVGELLNTIEKTLLANNGSCYTNEMLQAVEAEIQREQEQMRLLPANMSEKTIRERTTGRVSKNLWIKLAGVATGALLGGFFGAGLMVGEVVAFIKKGARSFGVEASAAAGAVIGGIGGYYAAEGADTAWEAAKRAVEALKYGALYVSDKAGDILDYHRLDYQIITG